MRKKGKRKKEEQGKPAWRFLCQNAEHPAKQMQECSNSFTVPRPSDPEENPISKPHQEAVKDAYSKSLSSDVCIHTECLMVISAWHRPGG